MAYFSWSCLLLVPRNFPFEVLLVLLYALQAYILCMFFYVFFPALLFLLRKAGVPTRKRNKINVKEGVAGKDWVDFVVLIPAHNEERTLPVLLASLNNQSYPKEHFRVIVIADNCQDKTAQLAKEAGMICYEKNTNFPSDKTQALRFAWSQLVLDTKDYSKSRIVLVDADCELDVDYLHELNKRLKVEEEGLVLQTFRYVRNARESSLALLDAASEALRQWVILGSREMMGIQVFICGSGVVFPFSLFADLMSRDDHSIVEDRVWQGYLLDKGIRTEWCPSAKLNYEVVGTHHAFQKQRKRWIGGQLNLGKQFGRKIFLRGIMEGDVSKLDYSFSLIQLPRSVLALLAINFAVFGFYREELSLIPWWLWLSAIGGLLFYIILGLVLIKARPREYLAVLELPQMALGLLASTYKGLFEKKMSWEATRDGAKKKGKD